MRFYKNLFGTSCERYTSVDLELLYEDECADLGSLEEIFSQQEIQKAIFDLSTNKFPGKLDFGSLNNALVVLIAKHEGAGDVKNFRPISLLNCIFKVITMALANRLRGKMDCLIVNTQSAFIRRRNIMDNVDVVQELLKSCIKKNIPSVILKLHFTKAFDSLNWSFLFGVLKARGALQVDGLVG